MSAKFLESFSGKFAEQWVATLLTPAFVFWAGGCAAVLQRWGWQPLFEWFRSLPEPLQIASLFGIFVAIAVSAFVVQRFDLAVLSFLEGYWHPWLNRPREQLIRKQLRRRDRLEKQLRSLNDRGLTQLNASERIQHAQLRQQWLRQPTPDNLMPTRLGNILRAAEQRSDEKYGLDAVVCWSRLWLLLPDAVKKDLQEARADLNTAARVWLWSLLCCFWALGSVHLQPIWTVNVWSLWPLLGLLAARFAYGWAIAAARTYGELIEATFDLYRHLLYQSIRWHLPADPEVERRVGRQLTQYLWRR
jgi:hypothetical protein